MFWVLCRITFCVKLSRFGLSSYVLGNVTFCGPTVLSLVFGLRLGLGLMLGQR